MIKKMKNIKQIILIPIVLILGCKESISPNSTLSAQPPFESFWFSARFNLPSLSPDGIQDLSFYSVWAESSTVPVAGQYRYESPNSSEEIKVITNGDIISMSTTGILNRTGDNPPATYTRDVALWSLTCTYELLCQINKSTKTISKATLRVFSETFNSSYDLTSIMFFSDGEANPSGNAPEWSIGTSEDRVDNVSRNHSIGIQYQFVVDDVLGTTYKN